MKSMTGSSHFVLWVFLLTTIAHPASPACINKCKCIWRRSYMEVSCYNYPGQRVPRSELLKLGSSSIHFHLHAPKLPYVYAGDFPPQVKITSLRISGKYVTGYSRYAFSSIAKSLKSLDIDAPTFFFASPFYPVIPLNHLRSLQIRCNPYFARDFIIYTRFLRPPVTNSLRELILDDCRIISFADWVFKGLHLTKFSLRYNSIPKVPLPLRSMPLKKLDLSSNKLTCLTPHRFPPNLTSLNLSYNNISFVEPGVFWYLPHLTNIDLSYNRFLYLFPREFDRVKAGLINLAYTGLIGLDSCVTAPGSSAYLLFKGTPLPCGCELRGFLEHSATRIGGECVDAFGVKFKLYTYEFWHQIHKYECRPYKRTSWYLAVQRLRASRGSAWCPETRRQPHFRGTVPPHLDLEP
ncbi:leucine-rich repeat transmembrane neuronal protein 1 [Aplysia californica]|uniref:Leucine-rich repeat transmembrane neuronal protein 1 n=1 Tax=Aplysia californica TaxID=6500 RepID=A0ABM1A386_APLCA|nr:leucine-rich repeat transmembrane neuronal protein 1 [Aplysia californica]XP_012939926.1 leucine-rich repeat transmembrane neuronal protein 1 [Aplysia californica]